MKSRRTPGGSLSSQHPSIFAFGESVKFLSLEELKSATSNERLTSVWPFIVGEVIKFSKTLKPQESANFDIDDVLHEIAVEVLLKNHLWSAEKGTYTAFAGPIIRNCLLGIREKSHTVHSPRNSTCRVKEYAAQELAGDISVTARGTWADIIRTFTESDDGTTIERPVAEGDILDALTESESQGFSDDVLCGSIKLLTIQEAFVVGARYGLWGQKPREPFEILGRGRSREVTKLLLSAHTKIRATMDVNFANASDAFANKLSVDNELG